MSSEALDELDQYIIYRLQADAQRTSAATIAEEYDVASSTVRKRITRLEDSGIIIGSTVSIDYGRIGYQLVTIIFCTAPIPKREALAEAALKTPGVISVRELMTGEENLHVVAVGRNSDDLSRIGRDLSELGLEISEEELVRNEYTCPFHWFGGSEAADTSDTTDDARATSGEQAD